MKVVLALSKIRRVIGVVTNSSADNVAPDPEILIVKAMEQRWVDGEGSDVGKWVSAACWQEAAAIEAAIAVPTVVFDAIQRIVESIECGCYGH
ncbi:hypothetical protein F0562_032255 [Nyssa sinensis]|uniref:Uncharacterized protein n=1 Tax=Nyssa sinensis TaxID=561372 RepID=A0A5J5ANI8_9ASTE|nr:hypothetical protein F0562_032255 [Nyssa sinensis]